MLSSRGRATSPAAGKRGLGLRRDNYCRGKQRLAAHGMGQIEGEKCPRSITLIPIDVPAIHGLARVQRIGYLSMEDS